MIENDCSRLERILLLVLHVVVHGPPGDDNSPPPPQMTPSYHRMRGNRGICFGKAEKGCFPKTFICVPGGEIRIPGVYTTHLVSKNWI